MNYMTEVAKMLGVELGEEFDVCFDNTNVYMKAQFTENGFKVNDTNMVKLTPYDSIMVFEWILCGSATIKRKPWRPQKGEAFYTVAPIGVVEPCIYTNGPGYCSLYKLGNCYKTQEEAEANRDKWVEFYVSDEVLEV